MLRVSRGTVSVDGQKPCSCGCGQPRDRPGQRYRKDCHAAYMAERRRGMVEVLLTPEEWAAVKAQRRQRPR